MRCRTDIAYIMPMLGHIIRIPTMMIACHRNILSVLDHMIMAFIHISHTIVHATIAIFSRMERHRIYAATIAISHKATPDMELQQPHYLAALKSGSQGTAFTSRSSQRNPSGN